MAKKILEEIASNIQQSTFFSLMADETTDAANKEQLVVVYRWIDDEFCVYEEFVGLRELEKTDSQSIFRELTNSLEELHLIFIECVASVMMGPVQCQGLKMELLRF